MWRDLCEIHQQKLIKQSYDSERCTIRRRGGVVEQFSYNYSKKTTTEEQWQKWLEQEEESYLHCSAVVNISIAIFVIVWEKYVDSEMNSEHINHANSRVELCK